jgi:Spy/CpxP family protein refolding chaperone
MLIKKALMVATAAMLSVSSAAAYAQQQQQPPLPPGAQCGPIFCTLTICTPGIFGGCRTIVFPNPAAELPLDP